MRAMIHIYRHLSHQRDEYVGRIDPDNGRIYSTRLVPDKYIHDDKPDTE
jgi:hypothetical protein